MNGMNFKSQRLGKTNKNIYGSIMEIVEYHGNHDLWVMFENGNRVHTSWQAFLKGNVRNVYDKTIYGIGFIGEGKYKPTRDKKDTPAYKTWSSMLKRCYSSTHQEKYPSYIDCSVTSEWHNFQNFAQWYDENYYEIENEIICLDKDILIKGNKVYSPEACIFVPERINKLFIANKNKRLTSLPMGIILRTDNKEPKFRVAIGNSKFGQYKTIEEAFSVYKSQKEKIIKEYANKYKGQIPERLYNAMIQFTIEIDD